MCKLLVLPILLLSAFSALHSPCSHADEAQQKSTHENVITTKDKGEGDLNNGIEDLKRIYQIITIYRTRNNGEYPINAQALRNDIAKNPTSYGFKSFLEARSVFTNPDSIFAEGLATTKEEAEKLWVYELYGNRPDKSGLGSSKTVGTKDVLAFTTIYFRMNIQYLTDGRAVPNPEGVFLVLWSDGSIEKVPYDETLYTPHGVNKYRSAFKGQAGVLFNFISWNEFYFDLLDFVPIGKPSIDNKMGIVSDNGGPESLERVMHFL
jgi:hypothetical protein